jgi:hypothetical protein
MAKNGMALAVIGGLLILVSGLAAWMGVSTPSIIPSYVAGATGSMLAVVAGILVLVGGWWSGKNMQQGAVLALVFSIIGLAVGGGWLIGSILGIVGGLMLRMKK